jgi:lysophospholipase L1-like esterase
VTWSELPAVVVAPVSRWRTIGKQLGVGAAAFIILWVLSHHTAAILVLVVAGSLSVVSGLSPRFAGALERVIARIASAVGRVLSFVLLGIVEFLVFTPIAAVLWLIRRDPLALGSSPNDPSLWRPHFSEDRQPLYERQFTYEVPRRVTGHRSAVGRVAFAVGAVVLLMLADLGVGSVLHALTNSNPQSAKSLTSYYSKVAAVPRASWWPSVLLGSFGQAYTEQFQPMREFAGPENYTSPYFNIHDGVRVSYEPPASGARKHIEVLFLGGSTLEGAFQRDDYTIPSDVARLAGSDGLPIHVVNRGQYAYTSWQEIEQLEELLTNGYRPNVVVFYDGVNDLGVQSTEGTTTIPSTLKAQQYAKAVAQYLNTSATQPLANRIYDAYVNRSAIALAARDIGSIFSNGGGSSKRLAQLQGTSAATEQTVPTAMTRANDAVKIYQRGVDLVQKLASAYGFRVLQFWQPFLYSKTPMPAESNLKGFERENPTAEYAMAAQARKDLRPPVIDLSESLNSVKAPVMIDYEHTNELGALVVAKAMYPYLKPVLSKDVGGGGQQ